MSRLIGLLGKARVGKDTAADHIARAHFLVQYAFADPLKDMLEEVFGDLFRRGDREKPIDWLGKSPRQLMQTLGTEWGRNSVHPDLWMLLADQEWKRHKSGKRPGIVVSDVRFNNEAAWITSEGGLLIEIVRPGAEQVAEHVSEAGIDHAWPRTVVINDGTLQELYAKVDKAISDFYGEPAAVRFDGRRWVLDNLPERRANGH